MCKRLLMNNRIKQIEQARQQAVLDQAVYGLGLLALDHDGYPARISVPEAYKQLQAINSLLRSHHRTPDDYDTF